METYFREWREFAQMSQADLAKILKVTAPTVAKIEQGNRDFNGKYLDAFAKAVGCRNFADPICRPPDIFPIGTSYSTPEVLKKIAEIQARLNRRESKRKRVASESK